MLLPKDKLSNEDIVDPNVILEYRLDIVPILRIFLTEKLEPTILLSKAVNKLPRVILEYNEHADPNRIDERKLKLLPVFA
jgi:hypothetical protein